MSHTTKDQRDHLCPALEKLCVERGGISSIPLKVAFERLNSTEWDIFISRVWKSIADRMTDLTPLVLVIDFQTKIGYNESVPDDNRAS